MRLKDTGRSVSDVFFSYSSKDRERVRRVRDALADKGFDVFWDQQTPAGTDWDTWIRAELGKSKCAVVFWSAASAASDNVRHEATVAKRQSKLISVIIEPLTELDIPLGLYSQQAANLAVWDSDQTNDEWRKFLDALEAKLTPRWVQEKVGLLDAELEGERARRESAETYEKTLRAQISKEAKIQQDLKRERDRALTEVGELRATVEERDRALQAQIAKQLESEQSLKSERDNALAELAKLSSTVEGLNQARPDAEAPSAKNPTKRWLAPIAVAAMLLAAAVSGVLVWSPGKKADGEAEAAGQATAALGKSEEARQAAEAKAADAEKAQQAAVTKANDADKARRAAEAKAEELAAQLKIQKPTTNPSQSTSIRTGPAVTGVDWNKGCLIC